MIAFIQGLTDRFLGRGDAAVTVPVFDGVLRPNRLLDQAEIWASLQAPGDVVADDSGLWVSNGNQVLRVNSQAAGLTDEVLRLPGTVTALARIGGGFAVALDGRRVEIHGGTLDGQAWDSAEGAPLVALTGLCAEGDSLIATDASADYGPGDWQRDLLERRSGGRVLRLRPGGQAEVLARGLAHPFGAVTAAGQVWTSESWRHRMVAIGAGKPTPVLEHLPGYPSRMVPAQGGGYWLSVFACRTQLVEFVLRERAYREAMMASMPPNLWVAPQLTPPHSFLEPLQGGAIKQMGVLKPWAPPRSYGLVLRLNDQGKALYSLHSRVDGRHHGVTAIADHDGALWVLSHGASGLLRLPHAQIDQKVTQ